MQISLVAAVLVMAHALEPTPYVYFSGANAGYGAAPLLRPEAARAPVVAKEEEYIDYTVSCFIITLKKLTKPCTHFKSNQSSSFRFFFNYPKMYLVLRET